MAKQTLTVVATMRAKPGQETRLRAALLALIVPSLADAGCVSYDLHQAVNDPASFLFYENWEDKNRLDEHLQQPHLQTFLAQADQLLLEPPHIALWEKIG